MENKVFKNRFNIFWVLVAIFGLLVIVAIVLFAINSISKTNPYGEEIVITDFGKYFVGVDENTKNNTFSTLYRTVALNYAGTVNVSEEAVIRDGSVDIKESSTTKKGTFIVDVPEFKQSYKGEVTWGVRGGEKAVGYVSTFTCLASDKLIYGDFGCKDLITPEQSKVPICNVLPIRESNYDIATRRSSVYTISCYFENVDSAKILINDFSGGNYESALNKIRELGYNPEDYVIEYINKGITN